MDNHSPDPKQDLHRVMQLQAVAHQKQREADRALISYLYSRLTEEQEIIARLAGLGNAMCCEGAGPDGSDFMPPE